jgi:hypothetical protein
VGRHVQQEQRPDRHQLHLQRKPGGQHRLLELIGSGGGMYNEGDFVTTVWTINWPVITGCTFRDNL